MKDSLSVVESFVMIIRFNHENLEFNCVIYCNYEGKLKKP